MNAPFFSWYWFIALNLGRDCWRSVAGTFGVMSSVMEQEFPLVVPYGIVDGLDAASGADGHVHRGTSLWLGDHVRVLSDLFAEFVRELIRIDGAGRGTMLVQLWGGNVPMSISRMAFTPARAA